MARPACTPDYENAAWSFYRFIPSVAANVVFIVLFGISTLLHGYQMSRSKTWYLSALLAGGIAEFIGYIGRLINAQQEPGCWTLGPYIMQNVLILIAPALMAASIYMILGRIILLTEGEKYAIIKRRFLTKLFVSGDVVSLLMQASGGGMMAINEDLMKIGEKVIIGGLFVQLAFFGFFITVAGIFHWRMAKNPTARACEKEVRWPYYLLTLYVTGALIWIRSLFRAIEFIDGNKGPLMRKELYVFVFDGMLMLIVLLWMNWFHPSEIGLLLRGDPTIRNGFELVVGRGGRSRSKTLESLSSGQEGMVSRGSNV